MQPDVCALLYVSGPSHGSVSAPSHGHSSAIRDDMGFRIMDKSGILRLDISLDDATDALERGGLDDFLDDKFSCFKRVAKSAHSGSFSLDKVKPDLPESKLGYRTLVMDVDALTDANRPERMEINGLMGAALKGFRDEIMTDLKAE